MGPRLQLGMTYYAAGRRNDAAREWREVLAMEPDNKFAKLYLRLVSEQAKRSLFDQLRPRGPSAMGSAAQPPASAR